jgi:hypothetical protein
VLPFGRGQGRGGDHGLVTGSRAHEGLGSPDPDGRDLALHQRQGALGQEAEQRHEHRSAQHAGVVPHRVAVDDEPPEAAGAHEGGDGGGGHDLHGRGAQAGDDQRRGDRQLDPAQDLAAGHAHARGGVAQVVGDLGHRHVGVGDQRRDGERHQRDERRERTDERELPQPVELGADDQQGEAGDGPAGVGEVDGQRSEAPPVAQPHRRRDGEHGRRGWPPRSCGRARGTAWGSPAGRTSSPGR